MFVTLVITTKAVVLTIITDTVMMIITDNNAQCDNKCSVVIQPLNSADIIVPTSDTCQFSACIMNNTVNHVEYR